MQEKHDMEINDLIIKFLNNNCNREEIKLLKKFISENEENKQLFEELKSVWLSASSYITENNTNETNQAWLKVKENIVKKSNFEINPPQEKTYSIGKFLKIAALWIFLMSVGALTFYIIQDKSNTSRYQKICEISTPLGSRAHIILPDSSEVWLNADTKLRYPETFTKDQRNVYLTGEAYFKVKTNKKWPFVVHASDVKIKALGTAFNVKAYPNDKAITTTLVEGIIKFESNESSKQIFEYTLKPKTKITYTKTAALQQTKSPINTVSPKTDAVETYNSADIKITENVNTILSTSWKDPRWVIKGERLDNLSVLLERRFDVKINLLSAELGNYKFTGTIENETLEQVLNYLKLANPIKYHMKKGQVDISINENLKENYTTYLKKNALGTN